MTKPRKTQHPIYIISSRWVRFILHFEYAALPSGIGFSVITPMNINSIINTTGWHQILYILWSMIGPILLIIGIWRPMHRLLDLPRNAWWIAPPKRGK